MADAPKITPALFGQLHFLADRLIHLEDLLECLAAAGSARHDEGSDLGSALRGVALALGDIREDLQERLMACGGEEGVAHV